MAFLGVDVPAEAKLIWRVEEGGVDLRALAVAAIAAMTTLGTKLTSTFTAVSNQLK
jgi:hypothetical protein